jgi:hypothetical protein
LVPNSRYFRDLVAMYREIARQAVSQVGQVLSVGDGIAHQMSLLLRCPPGREAYPDDVLPAFAPAGRRRPDEGYHPPR